MKNIILWKSKRKTEMFLLSLILVILSFYIMKIETMCLIYILRLFYKGRTYYRGLRNWNVSVLSFMVDYFIDNELAVDGQTFSHQEFFKNN